MSTISNAAIAAWADLTGDEQFYAIGVLSCDAPEILLRAARLARERARGTQWDDSTR